MIRLKQNMVKFFRCCLVLLLQTFNHAVYSLSTAPITISTSGKPTAFSSISTRQIGIIDGSELSALKKFVKQNGKQEKRANLPRLTNNEKFGVIKFVTGTAEVDGKDRRVIGLESSESSSTDKGDLALTLATIPDGVSDVDAISTAMASLVGVHCCIPDVDNDKNGSNSVSGKVRVLFVFCMHENAFQIPLFFNSHL